MKVALVTISLLAPIACFAAVGACSGGGWKEPITPGSATILPSPVNGEEVPKGPNVASSTSTSKGAPPAAPTQAMTGSGPTTATTTPKGASSNEIGF